jgi:rRNA-processing protein FCF1
LDTNILILVARSHIPLRDEVERLVPGAVIRVPSSVLGELDRLVEEGVAGARVARSLAVRLPTEPTPGRGDEGVLETAERVRATVVTADRGLAQRLSARGLDVLHPRDRSRLELTRGASGTAVRRSRRPARGNS